MSHRRHTLSASALEMISSATIRPDLVRVRVRVRVRVSPVGRAPLPPLARAAGRASRHVPARARAHNVLVVQARVRVRVGVRVKVRVGVRVSVRVRVGLRVGLRVRVGEGSA